MRDVYNKNIVINKNSDLKINKCLNGTIEVPDIKKQLIELKDFTN